MAPSLIIAGGASGDRWRAVSHVAQAAVNSERSDDSHPENSFVYIRSGPPGLSQVSTNVRLLVNRGCLDGFSLSAEQFQENHHKYEGACDSALRFFAVCKATRAEQVRQRSNMTEFR